MKALQTLYPDYVDEGSTYAENKSFNYPRPLSAPPSPTGSRRSTPAASLHGSDDEDEDSIDEEQELHELGFKQNGGN